jgi:1,2-dihydroxy-3-keto-5-methylthiopentene dioxygenase
MTTLYLTHPQQTITDVEAITGFLAQRGVAFARWNASIDFEPDADEATILSAYHHELQPYMDANGFQSADVITIHPQTENVAALNAKFLKEHTHSEDEVRFFVSGQGDFWFHLEHPTDEVFGLTCTAGDFLSVPTEVKHWFDMGPADGETSPNVKVIRIFTSKDGWTPHYTHSGIEETMTKPALVEATA